MQVKLGARLQKDVVDRMLDLGRDGRGSGGRGAEASLRACTAEGRALKGAYWASDYLDEVARSLREGDRPRASARGYDVVVIGSGELATRCLDAAMEQGASTVQRMEFPSALQARLIVRGSEESDGRAWATGVVRVDRTSGSVCGLRVASPSWSDGTLRVVDESERVIPAQLVLVACEPTPAQVVLLASIAQSASPEPSGIDLFPVGESHGVMVMPGAVFEDDEPHAPRVVGL